MALGRLVAALLALLAAGVPASPPPGPLAAVDATLTVRLTAGKTTHAIGGLVLLELVPALFARWGGRPA